MWFALVVIAVFLAGTAAGYVIATIFEHLRIAKRIRTEKVIVRSRIIAAIKEQHEQEVLQQIFQTVDAIHADTEDALRRLVNSIQDLLMGLHEKAGDRRNRNSKTSARGFYLLKNKNAQQGGSPHSEGRPFSRRTNAGHE